MRGCYTLVSAHLVVATSLVHPVSSLLCTSIRYSNEKYSVTTFTFTFITTTIRYAVFPTNSAKSLRPYRYNKILETKRQNCKKEPRVSTRLG
jgi:hypothetical protein